MIGISVSEHQSLLRSVGTHRKERPLSPLEVAELIGRTVAAGSTRAQCASALGISVSQVSSFLNLLDLDKSIQHLADWRGSKAASVAFSTMAELRRLESTEQVSVTKAALRYGLTWKEIIQIVQISSRSGHPISDCVRQVLDLRPQVITRHLFVGAVTIKGLQGRLDQFSQNDRDKLLTKALRQLTGVSYQANLRMGISEFTILSDHDLPKLLGMQPNELESFINEFVSKVINER